MGLWLPGHVESTSASESVERIAGVAVVAFPCLGIDAVGRKSAKASRIARLTSRLISSSEAFGSSFSEIESSF